MSEQKEKVTCECENCKCETCRCSCECKDCQCGQSPTQNLNMGAHYVFSDYILIKRKISLLNT